MEHKLELAANRAEPENQAELVCGPDPDKIKNFTFFQKIKCTTMPIQHVKGQPDSSTFVQEKGCLKKHTNCETPCRTHTIITIEQNPPSKQKYSLFFHPSRKSFRIDRHQMINSKCENRKDPMSIRLKSVGTNVSLDWLDSIGKQTDNFYQHGLYMNGQFIFMLFMFTSQRLWARVTRCDQMLLGLTWWDQMLLGVTSFDHVWHILGIYRLYWGSLVPDDNFGEMT